MGKNPNRGRDLNEDRWVAGRTGKSCRTSCASARRWSEIPCSHCGNHNCYDDDLLVYRRFGEIGADQAREAFGTDYLISTVRPLLRVPSKAEKDHAVEKIQATSFQDCALFAIVWVEFNTGKVLGFNISPPETSGFEIFRRDDRFWVSVLPADNHVPGRRSEGRKEDGL